MITVVGSFVVDLSMRSPHMPVPGETVLGRSFKMGPGGKGGNQGSSCCALWFTGKYDNKIRRR